MSYRVLAAVAVAMLALQGCAQQPPPPKVAVDELNDGIAKSCTFQPVQPVAGQTVDSTITMTNDGWCAFRASESSGKSYELGLVKQRPEHGELLIRNWNGETRVEYNPASGYVGSDRFTVALRPTGGAADATVRVAVTVNRGEGTPAAEPPPAEEKKPATTTTRRRPTSTKK